MLDKALVAVLLAVSASLSPLPNLKSDQAVISYTDKVILANRLSTNTGCLQYSANRHVRDVLLVDVFEIHDHKCGGDSGVSPLLFSIKYDLRRGLISSDEGSPEFRYRRIRTP